MKSNKTSALKARITALQDKVVALAVELDYEFSARLQLEEAHRVLQDAHNDLQADFDRSIETANAAFDQRDEAEAELEATKKALDVALIAAAHLCTAARYKS